MPQPKPKRKPSAKRKPAAKRPPEPKPQVNRMTETAAPPDDSQTEEQRQAEQNQIEETQEERDAAGAARREKVLTPNEPDAPLAYEPQRQELENADFDHYGAANKRQAELDAEREEHNRRTGDASL